MEDNKYQRGKIYKIISNQIDDVYYGSTIEDRLSARLGKHRADYKQWLNGKRSCISSFEIVKYEDAKIILVENYPCNSVYELTAREQYYIDNNKCINKNKPATGLSKKEYMKQYNDDHKNDRSEKGKLYRQEHRDVILLKKKQYREEHKTEIAEKGKEQILCDCGRKLRKNNFKRHEKGQKHQTWVKFNQTDLL